METPYAEAHHSYRGRLGTRDCHPGACSRVNKNGILKGDDATAYLDAIKKSGKTYELKTVGQLSSTEFMAACKDDAFKISFFCARL